MMLVIMGVIIGALAFWKVRQIQAAIAAGKAFVMPPEAVTTVIAEEESWHPVLQSVGTVRAVNGVMVATDISGIVSEIAFESGTEVKKGDILIQLDTSQEQALLRAAQARLNLAKVNLARARNLAAKQTTSRQELDGAEAEYMQAQSQVDEVLAILQKKTVRAPFDGVTGIRKVDLGQYLNPGDAIVSLQSLDPVYVIFSLPQQELPRINTGMDVIVETDGADSKRIPGKITAIESLVDKETRNVEIQATLANPDGILQPGMFVRVEVNLPDEETIIAIPSSSISYAPYGNSIFIVEDMTNEQGETYKGVRQQFVQLGAHRGDRVAVLSGLKPGEEVVTSGGFKLRNGARVVVDNTVQPSNEIKPEVIDN